jgi:hypothetical protein
VDLQRLVQCDIEQGAVVLKLITQHLLGLSLIEMGRQCASGTPLLLRVRDDGIRGGQDSA